jgi:hypothetical protein
MVDARRTWVPAEAPMVVFRVYSKAIMQAQNERLFGVMVA